MTWDDASGADVVNLYLKESTGTVTLKGSLSTTSTITSKEP